MNILVLEPPATSIHGNQRIYGGNGSNKSEFRKAPLDVMWMSGYLRKHSFDNNLIDANNARLSPEVLIEDIVNLCPDLIFISTSTCTIYKDAEMAGLIKSRIKNVIIVAFGTHVMAMPEETLKESPGFDAVIYSNEWEQAALKVASNINNLENADGIVVRSGDGSLIKTDPIPVLHSLDDLGFPAHDKLIKELYRDPTMRRYPKTMVQASRSCIAKCNFCCQPSFFGNVLKRTPDHIIAELKWIKSLGFKEVFFNDATFTFDHDWNRELFNKMIQEDLDLTWFCTTRAHCLTPEIVALMKRAGCHTIGIGMESVDDQVLRNIKKGVTRDTVRNAILMVREAKIDALLFCVLGFLGETKESMAETLKFLKELPASFITLGIAAPVPGTPFFDKMDEMGYLKHKRWDLYDPLLKPVFDYPNLSGDLIYETAAKGLRAFYLRPSYIWDRLKIIRSPRQFYSYIINFFGFVKRYVFRITA
jgi:anaerobic magnesium-protoporphyrin IX monomethyl ester cyclase